MSSREESDKDYAYSITTRVPECFGSRLPCHRLEQTYSLGPLRLNTEVVLRSSSSLENNRTLYTDDNGYQMMERRHREFTNNTLARVSPWMSWTFILKTLLFNINITRVLQNYFPMVRTAYIEDDVSRLVLVSDRAHGVSSQANGQLEVPKRKTAIKITPQTETR